MNVNLTQLFLFSFSSSLHHYCCAVTVKLCIFHNLRVISPYEGNELYSISTLFKASFSLHFLFHFFSSSLLLTFFPLPPPLLYFSLSSFHPYLLSFSSSSSLLSSLQPLSEMESSDDDTLSERSCVSEPSFRSERSGGSLSPCPSGPVGLPGDTLPWNLSKHERRKRKSQDSVLDPAERAVVRVAGKENHQTGNKS